MRFLQFTALFPLCLLLGACQRPPNDPRDVIPPAAAEERVLDLPATLKGVEIDQDRRQLVISAFVGPSGSWPGGELRFAPIAEQELDAETRAGLQPSARLHLTLPAWALFGGEADRQPVFYGVHLMHAPLQLMLVFKHGTPLQRARDWVRQLPAVYGDGIADATHSRQYLASQGPHFLLGFARSVDLLRTRQMAAANPEVQAAYLPE